VSSNYGLTYRKEALKFLEKQSQDTQDRIRNGLKGLINNPPLGDIKKLTNRELYRLRVGSSIWRGAPCYAVASNGTGRPYLCRCLHFGGVGGAEAPCQGWS
jgi:hypothetical protein